VATSANVDDTEVRERLLARWPGRKEQINTLLGLLGAPYDDAAPIFVHGPPVTGRGLHSFPLPLNLSPLCPFPLNLSLLRPPSNPN